MEKKFFAYSINMCNPIQNEGQFQRDINLLQDELKQLKKNKVYCKIDKIESLKQKMGQSESQKCIIKYRIKQRKLHGRQTYCNKDSCSLEKDRANQKKGQSKSKKCKIFQKMN